MVKIMFICHGNICRSPMAEFLMKDYVEKLGKGDEFFIASGATSYEEEGNGVHYGTRRILNKLGIDCSLKRAYRIQPSDYSKFDYFLCMDDANVRNSVRIFGGDVDNKVHRLLDYTKLCREVADPWYTGNFDATYSDITIGIEGFYNHLISQGKI